MERRSDDIYEDSMIRSEWKRNGKCDKIVKANGIAMIEGETVTVDNEN